MMYKTYHVAKNGSDNNEGSEQKPFLTINKAAKVAIMGDTILVHEGTYREWVKPRNTGMSDQLRITYKAAEGEKVIIKGSEEVKNWEKYEGTVWKAVLSNKTFGDYNPYTDNLRGDWMLYPVGETNRTTKVHTGDVYLNGKSFYEAYSLEDVIKAEKRVKIKAYFETTLPHPEDTIYQWYCEVDDENTTIYANFQGYNPNEELVEINVRKCCFYPENAGINYITVSGFEMAQGACPFTPPSADQPGLIGAHWSKGWIIENNIVHDAKCSGISIGKEGSTGHIECTLYQLHPGFQAQIESVFRGVKGSWNREQVGSHIVRNNKIYDCGQNGIVGNMGCVFSEIYGNEIYEIGTKHEFFGWEIAGIKFHAPIDVYIHDNCIYRTTLGLWLDWETQGTRVSKNIFFENQREVVVEVTHGPFLFDNNIMKGMGLLAQGGAFVNNIVYGAVRSAPVLDRSTPYHFPHSTDVLGCSLVYANDDRWFNNILIAGEPMIDSKNDTFCGTHGYDGCPSSLEEFREQLIALGSVDIEEFVPLKQPVYVDGNAYFKGSKPYNKEVNNFVSEENPNLKITKEADGVYVEITVPEEIFNIETKIHGTKTLEMTRIVKALYEDMNGNPITIDYDMLGNARGEKPVVGPFENLKAGYNKIKVW